MKNRVSFSTICGHEAAHGVMRWLRGLPATELTASKRGGLCAGTGQMVRCEDLILILLAGFAWESGFGLISVDFIKGLCADFDEARQILDECYIWRSVVVVDGKPTLASVDESLRFRFDFVCDLLSEHDVFIEDLAEELENCGRLSAQRVEEIIQAHFRHLIFRTSCK